MTAALAVLAAALLATALLPAPSVPGVNAQEYGCSGYKICIAKETIPASTVQFPFIIDIEEVQHDSVPTVDGATVSGPTTVLLSDGDEVGIEFYGEARITEVQVRGWELVDIDCEGTSDYGWTISGNTIEIYYLIGSENSFLDCTFVNRRIEERPSGGLGSGLGGLFAGQPTPLPTARPAAVAPAATAPAISPPRTGDAGLK